MKLGEIMDMWDERIQIQNDSFRLEETNVIYQNDGEQGHVLGFYPCIKKVKMPGCMAQWLSVKL